MTNEQAIIELRDLISDDNTDRENEALLFAIEKLRDKRPQTTSTDLVFNAGGHLYGVMGGDKIMEEFEKDKKEAENEAD